MLLGACSPAKPPPGPATLRTPVVAAELQRLLPGHFIDERPYPCDAGALALHADGKFDWFSGWGGTHGTYRIGDGAVAFEGYRYNSADPKVDFSVTFAKDGNGTIYYRIAPDPERELRLAKIDRNTPFISCGNVEAPPPPPGNGG
ncbi:hypothetical protein P1X14_01265 [Sphingomonas sp. AOB5]|uniref:hypothetical protein n=1 Tax=Sphingomonas sp. AOB5 TaxID=3034017 RepID=UPI0023F77D51|nr:hypothetical protein [Sphingomonas sp. AOB5]MDF7773860.1 hypothetical protein [Sphingomonas sp. AOB5]